MPLSRRQKALMWAILALVICSIPLAARLWLEVYGAVERPSLGIVGDFVMRDDADRPLTRDQLRRSVAIVVYWPSACNSKGSCDLARQNFERLKEWVHGSLQPGWTEEKNPLILAIVGEGSGSLEAAGPWRKFAGALDANTLLPQSASTAEPWLVVVDNVLQFAALESLGSPVDFVRLERVLSKTAFDQYLGNYLSRRTFMGPKRTQN